MATMLKQTTPETIEFGPFLDSTDGNTEETGLGLVTADILVSKNHAALTAKNDNTNPTGGSNGHYQVTLDATDTGTLGRLRVWCHKSGALVVWEDFEVVVANVYDSLVAGSDVLTADLTQILGVGQSATDLKDFADAGYDPGTNKVQGVVLTDTCTTLTGHTVQTGNNYTRLGAPAGASVSADIAAIEAQTDDIGAAGAGLTDLGGMSSGMKAEVNAEVDTALDTAVPGSPTTGSLNERSKTTTDAVVSGVAEAGTLSTTFMTTDLSEATDDHYNGRMLTWTSGVLAGAQTDITSYLGSTGKLGYTTVTDAPSENDTFIVT